MGSIYNIKALLLRPLVYTRELGYRFQAPSRPTTYAHTAIYNSPWVPLRPPSSAWTWLHRSAPGCSAAAAVPAVGSAWGSPGSAAAAAPARDSAPGFDSTASPPGPGVVQPPLQPPRPLAHRRGTPTSSSGTTARWTGCRRRNCRWRRCCGSAATGSGVCAAGWADCPAPSRTRLSPLWPWLCCLEEDKRRVMVRVLLGDCI